MTRRLATALVMTLATAAPSAAHANGESGTGPPTVFERFVQSACSPCVRESYPITSLAVAPPALPGFPRAPAATAARPGEITIEVLRAYQPVRPDWKSLVWTGHSLQPGGKFSVVKCPAKLRTEVNNPISARKCAQGGACALPGPDVWIIPAVEMGCVNVRERT